MRYLILLSLFVLASCGSPSNSQQDTASKSAGTTYKGGASLGEGIKLVDSSKTPMRQKNATQGTGTAYRFEVELATSEQIDFEKAWIRGKCYPVVMKRMMPDQVGTPTKKGEKIILYVYQYDKLPMNKEVTVLDDKPPFSFSGEGLIAYNIEGKQNYLQVKKIRYEKG